MLASPLENVAYTFDTFVVTDASREGFAAAVAVAANPGHVHNPLFLHGPPGTGKTHLLHAIAHAIRAHQPEMRVLRISADALALALVAAIRGGTTEAFRAELETVDVLLLDHVRFAPNMKNTQEAVLRRLEDLVARRAQVVAVLEDPAIAERPLFSRAVFVRVG